MTVVCGYGGTVGDSAQSGMRRCCGAGGRCAGFLLTLSVVRCAQTTPLWRLFLINLSLSLSLSLSVSNKSLSLSLSMSCCKCKLAAWKSGHVQKHSENDTLLARAADGKHTPCELRGQWKVRMLTAMPRRPMYKTLRRPGRRLPVQGLSEGSLGCLDRLPA